jgi:lipid-A-disaccharide synthase
VRILISCGEASGEQYAADLARELLARRPELELFGVGGDLLDAAGVRLWARREELAVMGFAEIVRHLPRLRQLRNDLTRRALASDIDLFLPIDYGGFHVSLARRLHEGGVRVLDFIPPKTWSWGAWRARALRQAVDECAVLFAFEVEHYRRQGILAHWVGHPLVERIPEAPAGPRAGLLIAPGSREQELRRIGPVLGETIRRLHASLPGQRILVSRAPGVASEWLAPIFSAAPAVETSEAPLAQLYRTVEAAIVTSGTATLEAALCGTPHLIVYRTSSLSYAIARRLATVEHIGMANIVLGRRAFPEFLQGELRAGALADAARQLLLDRDVRLRQASDCAALRRALGEPGAIGRVADLALGMLDRRAVPGYIARTYPRGFESHARLSAAPTAASGRARALSRPARRRQSAGTGCARRARARWRGDLRLPPR